MTWTCEPSSGNAVCPQPSGTGLPELIFNLPGQSSLRFDILVSVLDDGSVYEQTLGASTELEPVFPGDVPASQGNSNVVVNDRIFRERFQSP